MSTPILFVNELLNDSVTDIVMPVIEEVMPVADEVMPVVVMPVIEEVMPVVVMPVIEVVMPVIEVVMPVIEVVMSVTDEVMPVADEVMPVADEVMPVVVMSVIEEVMPVAVMPVIEVVMSVIEEVRSVIDEVMPVTDVVLPDVVLPLNDVVLPLNDVVLPVSDVLLSLIELSMPVVTIIRHSNILATHLIKIVNELYIKIKAMHTETITPINIVIIATELIHCVEKYDDLSGNDKQMIVIYTINKIIDSQSNTVNEKIALNIIVDTTLPYIINGLVNALNSVTKFTKKIKTSKCGKYLGCFVNMWVSVNRRVPPIN